jgi:hypothetical protein
VCRILTGTRRVPTTLMRKAIRRTLLVLCVLLLVAAVALFFVYRASQRVPEFYRQALAADPKEQRKAGDRVVERAAALHNDIRRQRRWQAVFTAEEINGWLAVQLQENDPDVLPEGLRDPRVAIEPDGVTLAAHAEQGGISTVLSLKLEPYVESPEVLAVRIHKARAGDVPLPLGRVIERAEEAARHARLHLTWKQADGDPVALITIPLVEVDKNKQAQLRLESVRLEPGRIIVTGTADRRK